MTATLLGLRTAIYPVDNLEKAKAWYGRAFGIKPYFDEPFYVGYNVGGYELGLQPEAARASGGPGPTAFWGVADIEDAHRKLVAAGAVPESPVQDVGEGILVASVKDPFGNVLGLIQNPHFKLP